MATTLREAYIVATVRTPVGKAPRGVLRTTRPDTMLAHVLTHALRRAPTLDPAAVDDVVCGCAMPEYEQGMNVARIGLEAIHTHEARLVAQLREALRGMNDVRVFGPEDSAGIVSFALEGIHPHDLGTILDEERVAIRAGHHCAQPLMDRLGVPATARASFGLYSDEDDVAALLRGIERTKRIFG